MPASPPFTRVLLTGALLVGAAGSAALAQSLPDQTGTGGGPRSTITAPNTSSVGRTKPPSGGTDATLERRIDDRTRQERIDDQIDTGICIGCSR
ncbi:hypothetical protein VQ02_21670 [Methylobacterium variabile]|jgi:hypothetical protein|uniref:Uncharacterized protein n=1 Tax=Methylobacterium variabile TaxID=298794 RepID=A0A0J6SHH5_9HYPH|nr:hypothetical protein [Methylobacterium variabile]KMO33162.1 hypothetical protein VQ02_21670 [Methylobacterium variabile]